MRFARDIRNQLAVREAPCAVRPVPCPYPQYFRPRTCLSAVAIWTVACGRRIGGWTACRRGATTHLGWPGAPLKEGLPLPLPAFLSAPCSPLLPPCCSASAARMAAAWSQGAPSGGSVTKGTRNAAAAAERHEIGTAGGAMTIPRGVATAGGRGSGRASGSTTAAATTAAAASGDGTALQTQTP